MAKKHCKPICEPSDSKVALAGLIETTVGPAAVFLTCFVKSVECNLGKYNSCDVGKAVGNITSKAICNLP